MLHMWSLLCGYKVRRMLCFGYYFLRSTFKNLSVKGYKEYLVLKAEFVSSECSHSSSRLIAVCFV